MRGPGNPADNKIPQFLQLSDEIRAGLYPQFVRIQMQRPLSRGSGAVTVPSLFQVEGKSLLKPQSSGTNPAIKAAWGPVLCPNCHSAACSCRKSLQAKIPPRVVTRRFRQRATASPVRVPECSSPVQVLRAESPASEVDGECEGQFPSAQDSDHESNSEEDKEACMTSVHPEAQIREPVDPEVRVGDNKRTLLLSPLFRGRPHTILFDYPPQCCLPSKSGVRKVVMDEFEKDAKPLYYRYSESAHVYNCVVTALEYNGVTETSSNKFNLYISGSIRPRVLLDMDEYQKYNHYPGSWQLGRKDNLWRNVSKMRRTFGDEYSFCPPTYLLPDDYDRFLREREEHPKQLWIYKPVASACGRGIKVLSNKTRIRRKNGYLISTYISNPHLLNGLKYDLRLYVCVSSYDPLRIYLYKEGLVRFATQAYTTSKKSVVHRYIHLTNYSVNKRAPNYQFNQKSMEDNQGNKWSHTALKKAFGEMGVDPEQVFNRVKDVIIKTVIAAEPLIVNSIVQYAKHRGNCFETYGFDVLLDEHLTPWLMEVNVSPSLNNGSPLDKRVKTALMADIYSLVGFIPYDRKQCEQDCETKRAQRMLGVNKVKRKRPTLQAIHACQKLEELDLPEGEIGMLMDTEEEFWRSGNFERIFPTKQTIPTYSRFLQTERVNNLLTWKLLMDDSVFLRRYMTTPQTLVKV